MIPRTDCLKCNLQKQLGLLFLESESESRPVESDSLRPRGLYSPWNSLGQNTGVGGLSLLQGIFLTQGSNPGLPHCRQSLYQLSHKGSPVSSRNILSLCLSWKTKKIISNIFGKLDGFLHLPGHISKGSHYGFLFKYAVGPVIKKLSAFPRQQFTAALAGISRALNNQAQCAGWGHSLASPG